MLTRLPTRVVAAVAAAALLTSCSGGDGSGAGSEPDGSGAPSGGSDPTGAVAGPTPYLPVPDGVVLTDPGSELGVGESAVVAWKPDKGKPPVGVLDVTVRKLQRAPIKVLADWRLDAAGRDSSLFYVTVSVENAGDEDLGGRRIPLYVADDADSLVESTSFKTAFKPCPSAALPETFEPGDKTTACLAYLVPKQGQLKAVAFRPTEKFNPVTWVGKVEQPEKKKPKKPDSSSAG